MTAYLNFSYLILLITSCVYAWMRGGWEGKWISAVMILGSFGTGLAVRWLAPPLMPQHIVFGFDAMALIIFSAVSLRTDRYWPLWITAFHLLSVLTYLAWLADTKVTRLVFEATSAFWSIPILLALAMGVNRDRKTLP